MHTDTNAPASAGRTNLHADTVLINLGSQLDALSFEIMANGTDDHRAVEIHEKIMAEPTHTLGGITIKARAAAVLVLPDLSEKPEDALDFDKLAIRRLIESICTAANVEAQMA